MERVLVTGGAGFIGSNQVGALLDKGYAVTVYDDLSIGRMENLEEYKGDGNFEFVKGDILDYDTLVRAVKGAKYLIHLAAISGVAVSIDDPVGTNRINVEGTLNVLNAAKDTGVEKVVAASSASVYGNCPERPLPEEACCDPLSPYAVTKVAMEDYGHVFTRLYDLPVACPRYFNVYGPKQDPESDYAAVIPLFITRALAGEDITIFGDGGQTRDFIFIEDVVRANILALESDVSGSFNIASGKGISIKELAENIIPLLNSDSKIVHEDPRPGEIRDSLAGTAKARKELGFKTEFDLESGLGRTCEWFRKSL